MCTNNNKMSTFPHFNDSNIWLPIDDAEIDRLQKNLRPHLRNMGITKTKEDRIKFVLQILEQQNNTCIWGKSQEGKYCWNEPKYNFVKGPDGKKCECICKTLKLQWGHLNPRCRKENFGLDTLCLMCGRCNNHIQSSRKPKQVVVEILSKLVEIIDIVDIKELPISAHKNLSKINEYFNM